MLVDVDFRPALQPLHTKINRIGAFAGSYDVKPQPSHFSNRFRLCRISDYPPKLCLWLDKLHSPLVGQLLLVYLIKDIQNLMLAVIVHAEERQRVNCKAIVKPIEQAVELCHHFITHAHIFDILKDSAASAGDFAQILMLIASQVLGLELFSIRKELFAQPFPRYSPIIRVMNKPVSIINQLFLVHPVILRLRRVE